MIIALQMAAPTRAWHRRLAERLEAAGHVITIEIVPGDGRSRVALSLILAVERYAYRARSALFAPVDLRRPVSGDPQLRIVLAGPAGAGAVEPLYDGVPGEGALFAALLAGRAPVITIVSSTGAVLAAGVPATEDPLAMSRALENVLSRLVTLFIQAVAGLADIVVPDRQDGVPASPLRFVQRGLAGKLARKFGPAKGRPDHWAIEYRLGEDRAVTLPDDGTHFYADPFPFEDESGRYIFFEDFPYATGKGVIGVVSVDADGMASLPRVVLEAPVHLSYPFLLREGSDIYMLPEMGAAGRLQLFRADPFPDRWVPDHILVEGIIASDATLIRHGGLYWLFATISEPGESTWDQLGLFYASSLFGPWTAHPRNPVLIDAGAARPAGAMWHEDGQLMRVAQDCRGGYGVGLVICRVDRLDATGFSQTVVARRAPTGGALGLHTLNRCGALEVIDLRLSHPKRRWHLKRRR